MPQPGPRAACRQRHACRRVRPSSQVVALPGSRGCCRAPPGVAGTLTDGAERAPATVTEFGERPPKVAQSSAGGIAPGQSNLKIEAGQDAASAGALAKPVEVRAQVADRRRRFCSITPVRVPDSRRAPALARVLRTAIDIDLPTSPRRSLSFAAWHAWDTARLFPSASLLQSAWATMDGNGYRPVCESATGRPVSTAWPGGRDLPRDLDREAAGGEELGTQFNGGRVELVRMVVVGPAQIRPGSGGSAHQPGVVEVHPQAQQLRVRAATFHARLAELPVLPERLLNGLPPEDRSRPWSPGRAGRVSAGHEAFRHREKFGRFHSATRDRAPARSHGWLLRSTRPDARP